MVFKGRNDLRCRKDFLVLRFGFSAINSFNPLNANNVLTIPRVGARILDVGTNEAILGEQFSFLPKNRAMTLAT